MAPGSPVEQKIQQMRFSGMGGQAATDASTSKDNAISEEVVEALKKQYGFDKPLHIRYIIWLKNLSKLDFGESFTYEEPAIDIIVSKFPVSIQFGLMSLLMSYLICIPLGIFKAIKHGTAFDLGSSVLLSALYSIPGFMLAILLLVFFAGGDFLEWFPLGGLVSDNYDELSAFDQMKDRIWHFVLPLASYMVGNFTVLTILMKNSLLDEIKKDYVNLPPHKIQSYLEEIVFF